MAKRDYYEILGVPKTANADEMKKAYRKLAMQYHPDKNPGDAVSENKFKELNEAYEVLRDDDKRAAYDRMGHAAFDGSMGGGRNHHGGFEFNFGSGGFNDIFEEMFGDFMGGQGRGRTQQHRGNDLQYNMSVTLEEAFKGVKKEITVNMSTTCSTCKGSGAAEGSSPVTCKTCQGRGKVRAQQGFFSVERACPSCQGMGQTIDKPCSPCQGQGRRKERKTLSISVPAGVETGTRIRLSGEGESGIRGGLAGDLYVHIDVKSHSIFEREEANIHCRVPIDFITATLGGSIDVPTIDGTKARVTIPDGTQSGKIFRLGGKGMSILRRTTRGDMFVHAFVETPVNLTKRQKELLKEFSESDKDHKTCPESQGFFTKVKKFLESLGE
ncbi:MAG: molecular chaperone DnaJ [Alphaproteobacteria bacterium]|nr:molecular chaperone DnaJ [Alphaproteobacteria bacterium]